MEFIDRRAIRVVLVLVLLLYVTRQGTIHGSFSIMLLGTAVHVEL